MSVESEEEHNARLDEQWRVLQEEEAASKPDEQLAPADTEPMKVDRPKVESEVWPLKRPSHREKRDIPRWTEAMGYLKRRRAHNPSIIGTIEEVRIVQSWLSKRGVEIVEPTDENKERAKLNPNLIVYSERQIKRRIEDSFKSPPV